MRGVPGSGPPGRRPSGSPARWSCWSRGPGSSAPLSAHAPRPGSRSSPPSPSRPRSRKGRRPPTPGRSPPPQPRSRRNSVAAEGGGGAGGGSLRRRCRRRGARGRPASPDEDVDHRPDVEGDEGGDGRGREEDVAEPDALPPAEGTAVGDAPPEAAAHKPQRVVPERRDRKSTRLNSSHSQISYAVFCLK